eukprot:jgi/Bigna1/77153/fgenesh1_pg.46_\
MITGVVAPSSGDWGLGDVLPLFSVSAAVLGVVTATLGPSIERLGPRASTLISASAWTAGWGFGYIAPISGLLAWFPDKRGLVQGLGMTSFGLGSLAAPVAAQKLIESYYKAPERLSIEMADLITKEGRRFAEVAGELKEVVVATRADTTHDIIEGGIYLVGSGDSGVAMTFATLGICYGGLLSLAAATVRLPPANFTHKDFALVTEPEKNGSGVGEAEGAEEEVAKGHHAATTVSPTMQAAGSEEKVREEKLTAEVVQVSAQEALYTRQFWLLLGIMAGNATAGLDRDTDGVRPLRLGSGRSIRVIVILSWELALWKTLICCCSCCCYCYSANTLGRLKWGIIGDKIGRRNTLLAFAMASPACFVIPPLISAGASMPEMGAAPLAGFVASMLGIISCYGGLFAVLPAYVADIYGAQNAGAIMGRLLCGYSAAAIAGPGMLAALRSRGDWTAVSDLATKILSAVLIASCSCCVHFDVAGSVFLAISILPFNNAAVVDPHTFEKTFGAPMENLQELWEKKTVSIQNLLSLVPPEMGVVDPTHTLYATTFYTMSGILAGAAMCSWLVRPLDQKTLKRVVDMRTASSSSSASKK